MDIDFSTGDLTLEEAEDFEEYTGVHPGDLAKLLKPDADGKATANPPTRIVTAIVWIFGRREDPTFTLVRARGMKFSELNFTGGGDNSGKA